MLLFAVAMGAIVGLALAIQSPINASLGNIIGPFQSCATSFFVGTVVIAILVFAFGTGNFSLAASVPCWQLLGGILGVVLVLCLLVAVPKLGATLTLSLAMLSQLVTSMLIDAFGLFDTSVIPVSALRIIGCALVALGIILIMFENRIKFGKKIVTSESAEDCPAGKSSGKSIEIKPIFVIFALVAGAFTAIQPAVNAALATTVGTLEASLISFAIGTVIAILAALISAKGKIASYKGARPWHFLAGLCGVAAVALPTAFATVLGMSLWSAITMLGQLVGGMIIDGKGLIGMPRVQINGARIAGALLIAAGIVCFSLAFSTA